MFSVSSLGKCCFFLNFALWCSASTRMMSEVTPAADEPCPKHCVCSGNPDAIRVDCSNLNLTTVPADIGYRTAIL
ncbi:hypothetical protein X975_10114, partial [Stegodyphus mimosarum]